MALREVDSGLSMTPQDWSNAVWLRMKRGWQAKRLRCSGLTRPAAQRPPRVWRRGAREVPVHPPGQAHGHAGTGMFCLTGGAFSKPARRLSLSR
jgi:hypothetical protein